ncbi:DUF302 domain-containing protein [Oleiagrimonas sp. MCCC 1A03011]|uniref:DUF302 domain-containing protein n=1 Tax=Oleiagrimonas sp. MCCC 1A03011 TaxID=1926883 RepID=UPI000DC5C2E0|nr:DUF302 domain-containing protein [Oleiagrimonas sp. MCCC 1A03011]RAP59215.1 hypothetical protein BTJ49_00570 [Oleiagrimonas sp. MCCC 1A03011]
MSDLYRKATSKSVARAFEDLQAALKQHKFGLLHHYDFQETLKNKGFDLPEACLVLEVCNPAQAHAVLGIDMNLNMALPCRISIYEDAGQTWIGMVPPTEQLKLISDDPQIAKAAGGVEAALKAIIDEAA